MRVASDAAGRKRGERSEGHDGGNGAALSWDSSPVSASRVVLALHHERKRTNSATLFDLSVVKDDGERADSDTVVDLEGVDFHDTIFEQVSLDCDTVTNAAVVADADHIGLSEEDGVDEAVASDLGAESAHHERNEDCASNEIHETTAAKNDECIDDELAAPDAR